jgi:biotin-dependent carboxylase-like uncharacterized protein
MSLVIVDVIGLALIQDQGRRGFYDIGVTVGGAMDMEAHNMANSLLKNGLQAATVELSLASAKFRATKPMQLCICGAESALTVNGKQQKLWQTFLVGKGDIVEIGTPLNGCRSYLAVAGGFDTPEVFGSRSIVVREKLGGYNGGPLKNGEELITKASHQGFSCSIENRRCHDDYIPEYSKELILRVVLGYQHRSFSEVQKRIFFSSGYEVSAHSDRMGYRLSGQAITCDNYALASEGICFGAIQVPADGQPIVLMRDRQTIGGYPKIGAVLSIDMAKLSQATPGCKVSFQPITVEESHNALHLYAARLERSIKAIKTL